MKRTTNLLLTCTILVVAAFCSGCFMFYDNPDAPDVVPPIGRPDDWPVYKITNVVEVVE